LDEVTGIFWNAFRVTMKSDPDVVVMVRFKSMDEVYMGCRDVSGVKTRRMGIPQCINFLTKAGTPDEKISVLRIPPPSGTKVFRRVCIVIDLAHYGLSTLLVKTAVDFPDVAPPSPEDIRTAIAQDPGLHPYLEKQCMVCHTTGDLKTCSGCGHARYCGPHHQRTHWATHKPHCLQIQAFKQ
jgi:hypothetical protein